MIVTIDGPAGAGKSSAARKLAERLGFHFLDTGAMYRVVTLAAIQNEIDFNDEQALLDVARKISIALTDDQVLLDGRDVTQEIRTLAITRLTRHAADSPAVRARLVDLQRQFAENRNIVSEGRDQATIVFPHAECKIFLTADERVRAERRHRDLLQRGEEISFDEVLRLQRQRDQRDRDREIGGLRKADDSIEVSTDGLDPEQVAERLQEIVESVRTG